MTIIYKVGDATDCYSLNENSIVAHIVNDEGVWGKGFVLALDDRWPAPKQWYKKWWNHHSFALGEIQLVHVYTNVFVCNMVAQHGTRSYVNGFGESIPPIRYPELDRCLGRLWSHAIGLNAKIHMPRIGTGLAGGKWEYIEYYINKNLDDIDVFVYDFINTDAPSYVKKG